MSRQQATKSRGENKASRGGGGTQSVPIPSVTNDAIPGRVSAAEWEKLASADDDEDFVGSLVEEIVDSSLEQCYENYLWKQVIPYTVFNAKDDLLQIIEWRFLSHDIGELNFGVNQGWAEDAEPEPGPIDSWAQGSVPVIITKSPEPERPQPSPVVEEIIPVDVDQLTIDEPVSVSLSTMTDYPQDDEKVEESREPEKEEVQTKPTKKKKYKRHVGRLPSAHVSEMLKTLERSESELIEKEFSSLNQTESEVHLSPSQKSLLKLQAGRPPGNKEVTFDEKGNVIAVMRLEAKSLPSHKVRVHYSIIDPEAEAAAQRLEAMRTGKLRTLSKIHWKPKAARLKITPKTHVNESILEEEKLLFPGPPIRRHLQQTATKATPKQTVNKSMSHAKPKLNKHRTDEEDPNIGPLPPSLIDSIDASPGVVIREGDQVKAGSTRPLGPLRNAPVFREDGKIIGNVTLSTKGGRRTLRMLGTESGLNNKGEGGIVKPIITPAHVINQGIPIVRSPFAVQQPVPPLTSNSVTSPT